MEDKISLSALGHTWILDLDGTIVKHNGYKTDNRDSLLDGAREFMESIPEKDMVIFLTSRKLEFKEITENFLKSNGIRYDYIIYGVPYGERILVNDDKPSGLKMAMAVCLQRDAEIRLKIVEDENK